MGSSRKTKRIPSGRSTAALGDDRRRSDDNVLAILVDERNGHEYYISVLDTFTIRGQTYFVRYNYEPDDGSRANPEIVIMRSWKDDSGEQVFSSITNKKELEQAFEYFFERYTNSITRS